MKKLALIIFLIPSFIFGQNSLEKAILRELNSYRAKNGLSVLTYDSSISAASSHHSKWMGLSGTVSHYETVDVSNFKELSGVEDRSEFFKVEIFMEICNTVSIKDFAGSPLSNEVISKAVIENFASSPGHDRIMKTHIREGLVNGVGIGIFKIKDQVFVTINL